MANSIVCLGFATVFAIVGLALIAVGFGTNYWQKIDVDEAAVASESGALTGYPALHYLDRDTGLFRICFDDNPAVLDGISGKPTPQCVNQDLETADDTKISDANYNIRIHLLRLAIALLVICMVLILIGIIIGCISCWRLIAKWAWIAAILVLVGVFVGVIGMAVWMGAEYMEYNEISAGGATGVMAFPQEYSTTLDNNYSKSYNWSFILVWVGLALCLIAGIIYLASIRTFPSLDSDAGARAPSQSRPYRFHDDAPPVVYAYDSNAYLHNMAGGGKPISDISHLYDMRDVRK